MSEELGRATVSIFVDAVNRHDIEGVADCLSPQMSAHDAMGMGGSREAFISLYRMHFQAFPDVRVEVLNVLADGDMLAMRYRATGTHRGDFMGLPGSGNRFEVEGADLMRVDQKGKFIEYWDHTDNLTMLQQLGIIPQELPG